MTVASRIAQLAKRHGVPTKTGYGSYDISPLRELEYLLHEVAHWFVLGNEKIPSRLSSKIQQRFSKIGTTSADSLEIDTALVTFLAGYRLGLWTDPTPIARSCRRNLRGMGVLGKDADILEKFVQRWGSSPQVYSKHATRLAKWFRPSAKLHDLTNWSDGLTS